MISRKVYELNEQDLIEILAEKFKTKKTNVSVKIQEVCVGYGTNERCENQVIACVEIVE